jgi:hypothetical protein
MANKGRRTLVSLERRLDCFERELERRAGPEPPMRFRLCTGPNCPHADHDPDDPDAFVFTLQFDRADPEAEEAVMTDDDI